MWACLSPIDLKSRIEEISRFLAIASDVAVSEHSGIPVARPGLFASEGDFSGQTEGGLEMVLDFFPAPARGGGNAGDGPQEAAGVYGHNGVRGDGFEHERVKLGGPIPLAQQRKPLDRLKERLPSAGAIEPAGAREIVAAFIEQGKCAVGVTHRAFAQEELAPAVASVNVGLRFVID